MEISKDKIRSCVNAVLIASVLMLAALGVKSLLPSRGKEVAPPVPVVDVQQAAFDSLRDYGAALAETHEETASRAETFKSYQEALDDTAKRNDAARKKAFSKIGDAMDSFLPGDAPYDPAILRDAFQKAAKGFRP